MKIWIDVANSPQVIFALPFIQEFRNKDYEVIITSRPHANTEELLALNGVDFISIGSHYGSSKIKKLFGLFIRCWKLYKFLSNKKINFSFSQSSFYLPLVSYFIGCKSLYTNDNEYAKGNLIGRLFSDVCYFPKAWNKKVSAVGKVRYYDGVKEAVYMKDYILEKNIKAEQGIIYFRPEAWDAQYYNRVDTDRVISFLIDIGRKYKVIILPRSNEQSEIFNSIKSDNISIAKNPIRLQKILSNASCFIGAGGSMSREIALSSVPTITTYDHHLLAVDRLLIKKNLLRFERMENLNASYISNFLDHLSVDVSEIFAQGNLFKKSIMSELGN